MKFTSVSSIHTNSTQCGVAKFGLQLAERIGVPFIGVGEQGRWGAHPLFSLKHAEFNNEALVWFRMFLREQSTYSVFWHDTGDQAQFNNISDCATHVFYADKSLGEPALFCPSLIQPKKRTVRLFTFGMAGKQPIEQYRKVQRLLAASNQPYHLRVSVGIHEGTSLDRVEQHFDALKDVMGEQHVTILGILTDDAVSEELANADYTLAFFEKGARANNTTIHAAIAAGSGVITNWDVGTPLFFNQVTKNIDDLQAWPLRPGVHNSPYTWDALLKQMEAICAHSKSTAV